MTPHISANVGEIAKTVIMPGDPLRVKYIAENFLDNFKLVSDVRGILAYTGFYKGKEVTVMASGMGCPSMGIYSYELFKFYNVENIIRIGSCGSYIKDLNLFDLVLVDECYSNSNYAKYQNGSDLNILSSSKELNDIIINKAHELEFNIRTGRVYCSDVFYSDVEDKKKIVEEYNCLATEMESFALFHNANVLGKKAICVLTVSDNLVTGAKATPKERETGFNNMISLVLNSLL